MRTKIEALRERLPRNCDAALLVSEENRRYFTGFPSTDGFLIVARAGALFLTDSRYIEAARAAVTDCDVAELAELKQQLPQALRRLGCRRVAVEASRITVSRLHQLQTMLSDMELDADGRLDEAVNALRMVKSSDEVEKIVAAQRIAEQALDHILSFIRPGVTEREIALELDYTMLRGGAQALSFETIAVSGANTSKPHGVPGQKRVETGDFVTMDFGAVVDGYHSDMTRTVAVGSVSEEQARVYETVLAAQRAAISAIRPDVSCRDADAAARDAIAAAGFGEYFGHGAGHGVGVEIHEEPRLSPGASGVLRPGQIVTAEPGIYLPGRFGVRIEDMLCVTQDGCRNLTDAPKQLLVLE